MPQEITGGQGDAPRSAKPRRIALLVGVAVVVIAAAVLLTVFLAGDKDATDSQAASDTGAATAVTSPYDFSELPGGSGPAEVENASYVSILLADEAGGLTAYGLNSGMPAAEALKQAVLHADEVDSDVVSSLTTVASTAASATVELGSSLTFVFADRGKLTFDLYVEQGLVVRGQRAWRVDGDLATLIEAAVAAGRQQ